MYARIHPTTRAELREWLAAHHRQEKGIWLVSFKKETGEPRIPYEDICEELVCFGWVDSRPAKLDARRTMLLCTPRKKSSAWSKPNKDRVARMTKAGKMAQAGLDAVKEARASGRWSALDAVERLEVPEDLAAALEARASARQNFDAFPRSARRGILEWIAQAKRPETRARRVEQTARLAAENERANQWPRT